MGVNLLASVELLVSVKLTVSTELMVRGVELTVRGTHMLSIAIRTQKIKHPWPISSTMSSTALVKMQLMQLLLASKPQSSAAPSSHSSHTKANNQ